MKESDFIEQNKEKWLDFENNLLKKEKDPSKTSRLFVQITDDLSYAQTFYRNRSVKLYLNGIARLLFNDLNKAEKKGWSAFVLFWKKELPLTMFQARRAMLISFLVFVLCFILGALTCRYDKAFAASILSESYVNMTNENIAKGDPMAVYKSEGEIETFLPILYNNLRVDFLTFFSGIFMAIGSLVIMVYNGVMVGVFQYFFIERGVFWQSFLGIWTHGSLEIPAIILSGGAGLTLGKGLLFPGTFTRFQAFKISGMSGLKIIMAVAPITLIAAFIEGFITRHTDIPDLIRLLFILLNFAWVILYFFYYPRKVHKRYAEEIPLRNNNLVYKPEAAFRVSEILSLPAIITESFRMFFHYFQKFWTLLFLYPLAVAILIAANPLQLFRNPDIYGFSFSEYFNYSEYPALAILGLLSLSMIGYFVSRFLKHQLHSSPDALATKAPHSLRSYYTFFAAALLFCGTIFTGVDFTLGIAHLLFPLFMFMGCQSTLANKNFGESMQSIASILSESWIKFLVTAATFALIGFLLLTTAVMGIRTVFIQDALVWVLTDDELVAEKIVIGFYAFLNAFSFNLYLLFSLISNTVLYYTLSESKNAEHLLAKIKSISFSK